MSDYLSETIRKFDYNAVLGCLSNAPESFNQLVATANENYKNFALITNTKYQAFIADKNKHVKDNFIMQTPFPTLYLTLAYLLLVNFLLPMFMRKRREFDLRNILFIYNLSMIIIHVYIYAKILTLKFMVKEFDLCPKLRGTSNDIFSIELINIVYIFYLVKLVEFFNTIFLILRKRLHHLTYLHIFHHATIFPLWWLGVNFHTDGVTAFAVLSNSLIHTIMYTHYILSLFGNKFKRFIWWKRYLGIFQMMQYYALIFLSLYMLIWPTTECFYKINDNVFYVIIGYSVIHIVLYLTTTITKTKKLKCEEDLINDSIYGNDSILNRSGSLDYSFNVKKRRPLRSP